MSDDGFFTEIAAASDDAAPYLIYADALMLRGDPRGDLISIQHALETAPPAVAADLRRREAALLEEHEHAWIGPLRDHRDALIVRWRFGFVHAARIRELDDGDAARPALRALLAVPHAASTLAELRIGTPDPISRYDTWPPIQPLIDDLAWHPGLRRLHVCDGDLHGMFRAPPVRLPEQAKQLATLVVQTPALELAWDASPPSLRRLELRAPQLDTRALAKIRAWPQLESLVVWTQDPSAVLAMLADAELPRLRHLGLCGTARTSAVVTELLRHPITRQLTSLDLRGGVLRGTKTVMRLADRVQLDLRHNLVAKRDREALAAAGANVHPQRSRPAPLTDHETLVALHEQLDRGRWSVELGEANACLAYLGSSPEPAWLYATAYYVSRNLPTRPRRDTRVLLADAADRDLVTPRQVDRARYYYDIGAESDELVEGFVAECWLWRAVQAARWNDDERSEIRARALIGTLRIRRGDPAQALVLIDRVLGYFLEHGTKTEQAWALRQRGNVDLVRSEFASAEPFYRRALAMYRELDDKDSESIVLSELAGVLWSRQDFEGAVAILRESIAARSADSLGLGSGYYNLGAVLNGMGRVDDAREAAEESLRIFRKHERRDGVGQALSLLGELAQRSSRHDEAEQLLTEALTCHRERGAIREIGITLGNLSRVALDRAEYAKAREHCEEAVELHRECGNKYNEGMQLLGLADAAIGEQRLDDALAYVDEAMVPLVAIENFPAIGSLQLRRAFVALLRGAYAEVDAHLDQASADALRGNYPELVGWAQLYRAIARARQGRRDDVPALLAEAEHHLVNSTHGRFSLAMARAVIGRLGGEATDLPSPASFDGHLLASFVR